MIANPLEPVVGADGKMITAVVPQMTLPKQKRQLRQDYESFVPQPDPYATLGHTEISRPPVVDPYAALGHTELPTSQIVPVQDPYAALGHIEVSPAPIISVPPSPPPAPVVPVEKNWRDAMLDSKWMTVLPFVGSVKEAADSISILNLANKMGRGEATPEDEEILNNFLIESQTPRTFGYNFVQGLLQLPAFAIELGLTGGAYTAGRVMTTQVLKRGLLKYAASKAGKAAIAVGSRAVGVAAQTAAARGPAIVGGVAERMTPTIQLNPDEAGELNFTIQRDEAGIVEAFAKSFASQMIEVGTERAGGLIDRLPAAQVFQSGLARYLRINPSARVADFMTMTRNRLLRNSFFAEWMEEEVAKPLHIVLGTETGFRGEENVWKNRFREQYNIQNYLLQTAILAVPSIGGMALQKITSQAQTRTQTAFIRDHRANLEKIGLTDEQIGNFPDRLTAAKSPEEFEAIMNEVANQLSDVVKPPIEETEAQRRPTFNELQDKVKQEILEETRKRQVAYDAKAPAPIPARPAEETEAAKVAAMARGDIPFEPKPAEMPAKPPVEAPAAPEIPEAAPAPVEGVAPTVPPAIAEITVPAPESKIISSAILTKQQMIDRGAGGSLSKAIEMEIPISKISGREPTPAMEGGYKKGTPITQPIEVIYEPDMDTYTLYAGNHRVVQAEANEQTTIRAFVEGYKQEVTKPISPPPAPTTQEKIEAPPLVKPGETVAQQLPEVRAGEIVEPEIKKISGAMTGKPGYVVFENEKSVSPFFTTEKQAQKWLTDRKVQPFTPPPTPTPTKGGLITPRIPEVGVGALITEPETPEEELQHGDTVDLPQGEGTVVGKTPEGNAWVLIHDTNKIVDSKEPFIGEVPKGLEGDINAIQKSIAEGVDVRQPSGYGEAVGRAYPEGEEVAEARPDEEAEEIKLADYEEVKENEITTEQTEGIVSSLAVKFNRKRDAVSLRLYRPKMRDAVVYGRKYMEGIAVEKIARIFKKDVIYFKSNLSMRGFSTDVAKDKIFLSVDYTRPQLAVFGHELIHEMQEDAPELYDQFESELSKYTKNLKTYRGSYPELFEIPDDFMDEFIPDVVGDQMIEPEFWAALEKRNPTLFGKVANYVLQFIQSAQVKLSNIYGTEQNFLLKDLGQVRSVLADYVNKYAEIRKAFDATEGVGQTGAAALEISVKGKPDIQQGGRDTTVYGTRKDSFPAKYAVVPREALIASHDPITFAKNPLYPLVNPRDYSSPGEQAKVITIRNEFMPDQHVTDATSAAVGPVMAAHVTDKQSNRRLVVLGGNTREMVTQSMTATKKKALADLTNERAAQYGVKALPDAEHELIRYMGEFDLRQEGVREKLQSVVDSLNPSPGKVQNIMEIAAVDASTTIKPEHLADITADITPEAAQAKVKEWIADEVLDRSTRSSIAEHPAQAQEYLRRVLVNAAFRNPVLAEFAATTDRKKAAGRGLIEAAAPTVVELRRKKQDGIADAIGRTMSEAAGYMDKGSSLQSALGEAAEQIPLDKRYVIVQDIAAAMRDRIVLTKKGINTDETIDNFTSFWDRVGLAVKEWEAAPELFGERTGVDDVIRAVMEEIKKEQVLYESKEIIIAPKTRRESRRKVKPMEQPSLIPEKEMPFDLVGEKLRAVEKPAVAPEMEITQLELFQVRRVIVEIDPKKSADIAEKLYGDSRNALRILKKQLAIIDSDPHQRKLFTKEDHGRLEGVFGLLEQRISGLPVVIEEAPPPVSAETAQSVFNKYTKKWKRGPDGGVVVLQSEADVDTYCFDPDQPTLLGLSDDSMRAISDYKAEGFYHRPTDTVVLIADNLERTSDVIRVGIHEATIHSGLRHVLGEEFDAELDLIGKDIPEAELTDVTLRYDLDLSNRDERLEAYEEYLGKFSETRHPTLYQRFIAAIKRALRAMGISEHLVDAFDRRTAIEQLVDAGREYMERGRRPEPMPRREGVRMALQPRVPEGTAKEDIDESRYLKRVLLKEEFTPEDRAELENYSFYKIQHNKETKAEIKSILTEHGPNESENMFFRDDKALSPAVRVPLGRALRDLHILAAKKTDNPREEYSHLDSANIIIKKLTNMGLETGQMMQSFVIDNLGELIEMDGGAELIYSRMVQKQALGEIKKLPVKMTEVVREAKKADTEAIGEVMTEKRHLELVDKILERLGTTARNGMTARLRNVDNQAKLEAEFPDEEFASGVSEDLKFSKKPLEERIASASRFGAYLIRKSKTLNYGDWSAHMKARYGDGVAPLLQRLWNESSISVDTTMRRKVEPLAKVAKKAEPGKKVERPTFTMTAEIKKLVSDWLAQPIPPTAIEEPTQPGFEEPTERALPIQKTIIASLAELGISEREGFKYVTAVQQEVEKRAKAKKEAWLEKFLAGKPISAFGQGAIKHIMEVSAMRRLDEPAIIDIFAKKMGLPKLTPEIARKMQQMVERIRIAPAGNMKNNAVTDIFSFMKKLTSYGKGKMERGIETGWAMWYANILSGYQTQERNIAGNFWSVLDNLVTSMIVEPRNARFAVAGFIGGMKTGGAAFVETIRTGKSPVKYSEKFGPEGTLELEPFGGPFKIFNNWKYVGRTLDAFDALFFIPTRDAREMMIAADIVREERKEAGLDNAALWTEVVRRMGVTDDQQAAFRQQAMEEYQQMGEPATKGEITLRAHELAEQQRPERGREESRDYSTRALFRNKPDGVAGVLGRGMEGMSRKLPALRAAVPFTNIVANVSNFGIDHSPLGFLRLWRGIKDEHGVLQPITGHRRAQLKVKAVMGTAAMIVPYLFAKQGGDDDDPDKKIFDMYGAGPKDFNKRAQWRETGAIPWSIRWGKRYYDMRLTPFFIPVCIAGSIRDHERWNTQKDENTLWETVSYAVLNSASVIFEMSFVSGINQIMTLLDPSSPESSRRKLERYLTRIAGTAVPNLFKQLDRTFDPNIRDNATVKEALLREVPIVSREGRPKINRLGEEIEQTTGPFSIFVSKQKDKPLWQLIVSKEAWISDPNDSARLFVKRERGKDITRKMTGDESYRYAKESGKIIKELINENLTRLQEADKEQVQRMVKRYVQKARERVKRNILRENREEELKKKRMKEANENQTDAG